MLLATAGVNLLLYTLAWVPVGANRYLMPTYLVLLPFLVEAGLRATVDRLQRYGGSLLAAVLLLQVMCCTAQCRWIYQRHAYDLVVGRQLEPGWGPRRGLDEPVAAAEAVVSTNNPWEVNFVTHRPTVLCPFFSRADRWARSSRSPGSGGGAAGDGDDGLATPC